MIALVLMENRPTQASGLWQKMGTAPEPLGLTVSRVWTRVILPVDGVVKVMSCPNTVVAGANWVAAAVSSTRKWYFVPGLRLRSSWLTDTVEPPPAAIVWTGVPAS